MDDTTQSRTSDVASNAATRKRRSSILKSQRPPRAPFCELEFNVCTPTDTTKSRRVSFSRRTGVAEFVTNEATTTWKNFYEEHNKSLESSGNDSGMNHAKQPIAHLGKRIFDQQFEEVEAFDFAGTLNPGINISTSINNIHFEQLECTESKLTAPPSNFELSALTETQSKLFGNNHTMTCTGEASGRIDVNFSMVQQIGEKDDLDEIQKDLQRHSNVVCQGPFTGQNISEYIEVDLNMTHVAPNDESNMSITDTISSPKVQDVSKISAVDKKLSNSKDWVADKENIVINPYIAPRESVNFAVTEMPEEVLVFDGKRLIVENSSKDDFRKSCLPNNPPERVPQRKTIVINCNDDLPNFTEEAQISKNQSCFIEMQPNCVLKDKSAHHCLDETQNKHKTIIFSDDFDDISITQAVPNALSDDKRETIVYEDEDNISMTQALPTKIMDKEKRRTIVYEDDNADISITKAVPANVILRNEKRNTIVFENEACNISMTQAIPTNIIPENITKKHSTLLEESAENTTLSQSNHDLKIDNKESRQTINKNGIDNVSITSHNSNKHDAPQRRTTVVFDNDFGNISVTQALPTNIIIQKSNTTAYGNDGNISMTQALPANILLGNTMEPNRRRTVVYEDDAGNLSMTQAVSNQVIQNLAPQKKESEVLNPLDIDINIELPISSVSSYNGKSLLQSIHEDVSNSQAKVNEEPKEQNDVKHVDNIKENKRQTIVFQDDAAEISITQAVPVRQVIENMNILNLEFVNSNKDENKRKTVIFDNENGDISMTQAVPIDRVIDIIRENKQNEDLNNYSQIKTSHEMILNNIRDSPNSSVIDIIGKENSHIETITDVLHPGDTTNKRRTVVFENNDADISMTQAVPMNKVIDAIQNRNQDIEANYDSLQQDSTKRRTTVVFETDDDDLSITQAVSMNKVMDAIQKENTAFDETKTVLKEDLTNKRSTVVFENEEADVSMTQAVDTNKVIEIMQNKCLGYELTNEQFKEQTTDKSRTIVFENDEIDISMTEEIPRNQFTDKIPKEDHIEAIEMPKRGINSSLNEEREDNDAGMSVTQITSQNQAHDKVRDENSKSISQHKSEITINDNENATINMSSQEIECDEGDISMTQLVSSSIISIEEQEKRRPEIVESVETLLENKDLFMDIDKLIGESNENKSTVKLITEDHDISMTDINHTDYVEKKSKAYDDYVCVTNTTRESFTPIQLERSGVKIEEPVATPSKPIPSGLATIQRDINNESNCKDLNSTKLGTQNYNDVIVYQSMTRSIQKSLKSTDKRDSLINKRDTLGYKEGDLDFDKVSSSETKEFEKEPNSTKSESDSVDVNEDTNKNVVVVKAVDSKPSNSILDDLLDMSQSSLEGIEDKKVITFINSLPKILPKISEDLNKVETNTTNSMDTMFYITRNSDESESTSKTASYKEIGQIEDKSPLSIEYKDDDEPAIVRNVHTDLSTIKSIISRDRSPKNDLEPAEENVGCKVSLDTSRRKSSKCVKLANDTTELLEMLSDFTERRVSRNVPLDHIKEMPVPESLLSLEKRIEKSKQESRFSRGNLKRQSMALSREDLMNNLSMAAEALQRSRSDFDESDSIEEVKETPNISKEHRKSVKLSTDVVKTLQFEDDSITEKTESPLKKTAFGETSYMKDTKTRVIPDFLGDVSDGIKELMDDLVKPILDAQPFARMPERKFKRIPSSCSTEVQANLLTSSQIDLTTELYSTTTSVCEINKMSSVEIITDAVNRSITRTTHPAKSTPMVSESEKMPEMDVASDDSEEKYVKTIAPQRKSVPLTPQLGNVLIFDQLNPLNNVLLTAPPMYSIDTHKYDPIDHPPSESQPIPKDKVEDQDKVSNQYNVEFLIPIKNNVKTNDSPSPNMTSNISKPALIDQSTEPENQVCDMEVNTVIAMKGNNELLEASSSLTLVEDDTRRNITQRKTRETAISPVTILYREPKNVEQTPTDAIEQSLKPKKRVYSPMKKDHNSTLALDVTPKPVSKLQKRSMSPEHEEPTKLPAEHDKSKKLDKSVSQIHVKAQNKKPGTTVTVQQLVTMVHKEPIQGKKMDSTTIESTSPEMSEVVGTVTSSEVLSSFASSNNLRDESHTSSITENSSKVDWLPMSISHLKMDTDSEEDILATIDAMPFMGGPDCQWESVSRSAWTLLLLHSRLRLTLRFAGDTLRHDTPVSHLELETLHQDKKNPIVYLCVSFAAEMMRFYMGRGCARACDARKLVRRLAGAARLAAQWARAMHDARDRLAFSLTHDGKLVLKVANVSLRTVWEVSMRLELTVDDARSPPWPRACGVRVASVLSARAPPAPPALPRALAGTPRDWGHAPRTVWKIFRYLKHRKREDDTILHV